MSEKAKGKIILVALASLAAAVKELAGKTKDTPAGKLADQVHEDIRDLAAAEGIELDEDEDEELEEAEEAEEPAEESAPAPAAKKAKKKR